VSRRKVLAVPFPEPWRELLARRVSWYATLRAVEQERMEDLTRLLLAASRFEGAGGLDIDDEIRVVIAYQACLLILNLGIEWYRDVKSVIIYPSTVVRAGTHGISDGIVDDSRVPLSGQALLHGPMVIVWDTALRQARHPERGHNVVLHEFAHKIDMFDGSATGMPRLRSRPLQLQWRSVMDATLQRLRTGPVPPLDPYGSTNAAELFAVATEAFFEAPTALRRSLPTLYAVLAKFYGQDTAHRLDR
jgi:Mlc titration factor MtfA (ptsG expression regulator)